MQRKHFTYAALTTMVIALVVFDLSLIGFGVVAGVGFFAASAIEDGFSGREGLYLLFGAAVLFLASYGLAYWYNESFTEFANTNFRYLQRVPFFAVVAGVWGLCLVVQSLITGRWLGNK